MVGGLTLHLKLRESGWGWAMAPRGPGCQVGVADGVYTAYMQIIRIRESRDRDWATSGESRVQSWLLGVHGIFLLPSLIIHKWTYFP